VNENISRGQRTAARAAAAAVASVVDDAAAPLREDADGDATSREEEPAVDFVSTAGSHTLPGYAAWFRKDATHEIEKIGVPEFFGEDAAEDAESRYRALRDATMSSFAPGSFLRFDGALRRAMAAAAPGANADADTYATQQRVYDFCHRWGLINWTAVDQTGGPRLIDPGARRDEIKSEKPAGTNAAAADALFRFDPAPADGAAAVAAAVAAARELEARAAGIREVMAPRVGRPPKNRDPPPMRSADGDLLGDGLPADGLPAAARVSDSPASRRCRGCSASLVGTGRAYYRAETAVVAPAASSFQLPRNCADPKPELDVTCVACFAAGNLPDGASSARFARVVSATRGDERSALAAEGAPGTLHARDSDAEPEPDADANDWTDQETLTLLEAIERHGEDWSSVASRVATKNAEQCVRRFARLPVEDAFLEALAKGAVVDATPSETPSEETPFAGASNPVMAVVAFLATCVGPRVAAAAAKAALARLAEAAGDGGGAEGDGADAGGEDLELGPAPPVTREQAVVASAEGLAAAAVHAKLLADRDEHEMEKLAVGVVEMQMRKIELKLRQMEDLDAGLARERAAVDRMFAAIAAERGREEKTRKEAEARAKSAEEEEARRRDAEAAAAKAAAEAAAAAEAERREIAAMLAASAPPAPAP
jgi:SWI/SNF related-matrix-associated actin-dependent regulator of chromatin subfamily C